MHPSWLPTPKAGSLMVNSNHTHAFSTLKSSRLLTLPSCPQDLTSSLRLPLHLASAFMGLLLCLVGSGLSSSPLSLLLLGELQTLLSGEWNPASLALAVCVHWLAPGSPRSLWMVLADRSCSPLPEGYYCHQEPSLLSLFMVFDWSGHAMLGEVPPPLSLPHTSLLRL